MGEAMSASRPRLGFLGVGWIGRHRLEAVARSGAAEVVAIADPVESAAQEASRLAEGCRVGRGLEDVLAAEVDGLVIATPSALHAEQALAALEQGVAVFCQKPLGRTAEEVKRVVEAARAADVLLGVDLSYRHTEAVQCLRPLVAQGRLGRVYAVDLVFHNAYGPDKPWFYDPVLSGGGCVMDLGIHLVDLALWVLGFPEVRTVQSHLSAGGQSIRGRERVEDYATALLELEGGTSVRLACSWRLPCGREAVIEASFYGTEGGASLRNVNGSFYDFIAEQHVGTRSRELCRPPDAWGGRAAVDWARRLASGERFDSSAERLVDVAHTLDSIYLRA
jgi:predicted dehydrogenase